jgi:hypothetical protein
MQTPKMPDALRMFEESKDRVFVMWREEGAEFASLLWARPYGSIWRVTGEGLWCATSAFTPAERVRIYQAASDLLNHAERG